MKYQARVIVKYLIITFHLTLISSTHSCNVAQILLNINNVKYFALRQSFFFVIACYFSRLEPMTHVSGISFLLPTSPDDRTLVILQRI